MNARRSQLLREVEKLEAERLSRRPDIPADRATFARDLGIIPDPWQDRLLRSDAPKVLLNCCRQSGKSTMAAVIAVHRALAVPGSLVLCLAPALRQSQELFGKVLGFYRDLARPIPAEAEQRLGLELSTAYGLRLCRAASAP